MKRINLLILFALCVSSALADYTEYDARIGDKEVLTPAPAASPRINGPKIYGVRPGNVFLYRIPCQGERPIGFQAEGLPQGLTLDPKTGIITGTAPEGKGTFDVVFRTQNSKGKTERPFKIVVGDKIALTPPTGWNSWGGHMVEVSDKVMREAADVFENRGLADVGFQYVGIDDCWMRLTQEMYDNRSAGIKKKHAAYDYKGTNTIGPIHDAKGEILTNGKFPDMKALTAYIHGFGLKAGIYSSPGSVTCQGWSGSLGYEKETANQIAIWGFDLLKYDLCSGRDELKRLQQENPGFQHKNFWKPMADYLKAENRDILFNLCQYGLEDTWKWAPSLGIETWRIGGDLNHNVKNYFVQALKIAGPLREYSKPGQWNDPDFMYIDRIRRVQKMAEPSVQIPLDTNQRYQYVTLWSIICAPFFFSCDIENIDDFTIGLLANADVFNINQDELGQVAKIIKDTKKETVMVKDLADGTQVLAVFNRDAKNEAVIQVDWDAIGGCCEHEVF